MIKKNGVQFNEKKAYSKQKDIERYWDVYFGSECKNKTIQTILCSYSVSLFFFSIKLQRRFTS